MKKLFDNQVFSFFFGVIFTLIIGWISWISGESTNVWIFSIIVGLFGDGIKEVVNKFMLENPLLSEYIDEYNYNKSIKEELNEFFKERVDLSRLSNGIPCNHEFVKLNNHLLCMNCFLKEEELDYQSEELIDFLISAALHQGMYIDEIDESELGILEEAKNNHKALINELLSKKNNMNETDKHNIDETIKTLEDNRTNEYREYLRNQRNKKLSIKK